MRPLRYGLTLAVLRKVCEKVGAAVPVGVRISQGKVNDFHHKWQGGERDAEVVFGSLAESLFLVLRRFDQIQVVQVLGTAPRNRECDLVVAAVDQPIDMDCQIFV